MGTHAADGSVVEELVALVRRAAGECLGCGGTGKAYVYGTDVVPVDEMWNVDRRSPVDCPFCVRHRAVLAKLGVDVPVVWQPARDEDGDEGHDWIAGPKLAGSAACVPRVCRRCGHIEDRRRPEPLCRSYRTDPPPPLIVNEA